MTSQDRATGISLTRAERDAITDALIDDRDRADGTNAFGPDGTDGRTQTIYAAVERIVSERVAAADERATLWRRALGVAQQDRDAALDAREARSGEYLRWLATTWGCDADMLDASMPRENDVAQRETEALADAYRDCATDINRLLAMTPQEVHEAIPHLLWHENADV